MFCPKIFKGISFLKLKVTSIFSEIGGKTDKKEFPLKFTDGYSAEC